MLQLLLSAGVKNHYSHGQLVSVPMGPETHLSCRACPAQTPSPFPGGPLDRDIPVTPHPESCRAAGSKATSTEQQPQRTCS